jgi:hypothetical protein
LTVQLIGGRRVLSPWVARTWEGTAPNLNLNLNLNQTKRGLKSEGSTSQQQAAGQLWKWIVVPPLFLTGAGVSPETNPSIST